MYASCVFSLQLVVYAMIKISTKETSSCMWDIVIEVVDGEEVAYPSFFVENTFNVRLLRRQSTLVFLIGLTSIGLLISSPAVINFVSTATRSDAYHGVQSAVSYWLPWEWDGVSGLSQCLILNDFFRRSDAAVRRPWDWRDFRRVCRGPWAEAVTSSVFPQSERI